MIQPWDLSESPAYAECSPPRLAKSVLRSGSTSPAVQIAEAATLNSYRAAIHYALPQSTAQTEPSGKLVIATNSGPLDVAETVSRSNGAWKLTALGEHVQTGYGA